MEFEHLVKLIEAVSDSELTGFKYEENGVKLNIQKEKETVQVAVQGTPSPVPAVSAAPVQNAAPTAATEEQEAPAEEKPGNLVKSPLVGTFYAAPAEDAAPFVAVGDNVKKGQTIAIVEAMKLMNDIESEFDGVVMEVLVENGEAVEYGQPLFRVA